MGGRRRAHRGTRLLLLRDGQRARLRCRLYEHLA